MALTTNRLMMRIETITVSTAKNATGWAASWIVQCGTAMSANTQEIQYVIHAGRCSRVESSQPDTKVGIEPMNTTQSDADRPSTGLSNIAHSAVPITAPTIPNASTARHPGNPYLRASITVSHAIVSRLSPARA